MAPAVGTGSAQDLPGLGLWSGASCSAPHRDALSRSQGGSHTPAMKYKAPRNIKHEQRRQESSSVLQPREDEHVPGCASRDAPSSTAGYRPSSSPSPLEITFAVLHYKPSEEKE